MCRRSSVRSEQRTLNPRVGGSNPSAGTTGLTRVLCKVMLFMLTLDILYIIFKGGEVRVL